MTENYKKGDYKKGKGYLVEDSPEGPLYKVESIWISPLAHKVAEGYAKKCGV